MVENAVSSSKIETDISLSIVSIDDNMKFCVSNNNTVKCKRNIPLMDWVQSHFVNLIRIVYLTQKTIKSDKFVNGA